MDRIACLEQPSGLVHAQVELDIGLLVYCRLARSRFDASRDEGRCQGGEAQHKARQCKLMVNRCFDPHLKLVVAISAIRLLLSIILF